MKSLRLSYFELHDIHPRVKWKSGRGQKLALSPEKNLLTFHKVLKLPEVHEAAVRLVFTVWHFLTTGVLFCENGIFLWFCPFFRNSSVSYPLDFFVKGNLTAGACTSDNLKTLWKVCKFFSGDNAHFWPRPLFHFTRGWISCNSNYESRRDFILGLKDAEWALLS